jgi:hypothetical protein
LNTPTPEFPPQDAMTECVFDAFVDHLIELGKQWRRGRDRQVTSLHIRDAIVATCESIVDMHAEGKEAGR